MKNQTIKLYIGALIAGFLTLMVSAILSAGQANDLKAPSGERLSEASYQLSQLKKP